MNMSPTRISGHPLSHHLTMRGLCSCGSLRSASPQLNATVSLAQHTRAERTSAHYHSMCAHSNPAVYRRRTSSPADLHLSPRPRPTIRPVAPLPLPPICSTRTQVTISFLCPPHAPDERESKAASEGVEPMRDPGHEPGPLLLIQPGVAPALGAGPSSRPASTAWAWSVACRCAPQYRWPIETWCGWRESRWRCSEPNTVRL